MAKNPEDRKEKPEDKEQEPAMSQATIAGPKLDESGKPTQRAVRNAKHAHAIAKAHKQKAIEGRLATATTVTWLYDGNPPYNQAAIIESAQDWRNNYSTHFLPSIIDRVKPQLKDPLESAATLTHSKLPNNVEDGARKSRSFQMGITKLIRDWNGWSDLLDGITQEDVVHGVATPAHIDDDWRPRLFQFDEAFLPKGCGQHAANLQTVAFSQRMLIHDFLELFRNQDAARLAKYNVQECIAAANAIVTTPDTTDLEKLSTKRETGTGGYNYDNDDRTVDLFHVLAREYDGGVDLWTVTQKDGREIRHVEHLHDSMEDGITLFTIQTGNRKFYGSKGLGRTLANIHIAIERGRNFASDMTFLSGLVIVQADKADTLGQQPMVRHPWAILPKSYEVVKEQFQFNPDAFDRMDTKLVAIAESLAGAFIPPQIDKTGTSNTKIEAAQRALREQAVSHGVLGRFLGQTYNLISTLQRKICNKTNLKEAVRIFKIKRKKEEKGVMVLVKKVWDIVSGIFGKDDQIEPQPETKLGDPEAVNMLISLLEQGLSPQEIAILALTPAKADENDDEQTRDQSTVEFISANAANPMQNQGEAYQMLGEIMIGKDRTDRLRIANEDPNVQAVARRQQLIEFSEMLDGVEMPVASIDNHTIHRVTLAELMMGLMPAVETAPTPAIVQCTALSIEHYQGHLDLDPMIPPAELKQQSAAMEELRKIVIAAGVKLAELARTAPGTPVEGIPPQLPPGTPMGTNGAQTGPVEEERENARAITEITLAAQEETRLGEELSLKREQHEHKVAMDTTKAVADTAKTVSDAARKAMQEGESDAAQDLLPDPPKTAPP